MDQLCSPTLAPEKAQFLADVLDGLRQPQKTLPCKYFYDETGSKLFDRICDLDEYYVTRTELAIMRASVNEMIADWGPEARLVEYGSGSSLKTRLLLEADHDLAVYHPVDISGDYLQTVAEDLRERYPCLNVEPVAADFTTNFDLPSADDDVPVGRTIAYFPGSTIGNFDPESALNLLRQMHRLVGSGGGLLIGVDLVKPVSVLEAAYNDAEEVTAAFNLNLLHRINTELDGDFDLDRFEHVAIFNRHLNRIEMHLRSRVAQEVVVGGETFRFERGETIHTENSHKYSLADFAHMAEAAGFSPQTVWTDKDDLFSVHNLIAQ